MAQKQKVTKNFILNIKGILDIDENGKLIVSIEDRGELDLITMVDGFLGRECSISVKYDEDYECYTCMMDLDEDEYEKFITNRNTSCPYYQNGDEYLVVRKQM